MKKVFLSVLLVSIFFIGGCIGMSKNPEDVCNSKEIQEKIIKKFRKYDLFGLLMEGCDSTFSSLAMLSGVQLETIDDLNRLSKKSPKAKQVLACVKQTDKLTDVEFTPFYSKRSNTDKNLYICKAKLNLIDLNAKKKGEDYRLLYGDMFYTIKDNKGKLELIDVH